MRIKLNFTNNLKLVPNNLNVMNSYINKCLGVNNEYHNTKSNYSISALLGGIVVDNGKHINYPNGGYIVVTSLDSDFITKILMGVLNNDIIDYGMKFNGVDHIKESFYNGWNYFKTTDTGFIIKKPRNTIYDNDDTHKGYYTLNDPNLIDVLKNHIINKFGKIGDFDFTDMEIQITDHQKNRVEFRYSKQVKNSVNICQINIKTNKKLAETIYNYGIGQSCGSGFGTVYSTQYNNQYL